MKIRDELDDMLDRVEREVDAPGGDESWPEAPNVPGRAVLARIPIDVLPDVMARHVRSVSGATQTPPELAAVVGLGVVSAAVVGDFVVNADPVRGWQEAGWIYAGAVSPPGTRKSSVYDSMASGLREWERERVARRAPAYRKAYDVVRVRESQLNAASKQAAKGDASMREVEVARDAYDDAIADLPTDGRLFVSDATPEAVVARLVAQGERAAVLDPEGGALVALTGIRYNGDADTELLTKAWSGESHTTDRKTTGSAVLDRPCLSIALCVQPGVLADLPGRKVQEAAGALARFLWCQPPHGLGRRLTGDDVPPLDHSASRRWHDAVVTLAGFEPIGAGPQVISLSDEARAIAFEYQAALEPDMADGARLGSDPAVRGWAAKAVGQAVRVAALLELLDRADHGLPLQGGEVTARWMRAGVSIVRALESHAVAVLGSVGPSAHESLLRYVLDRVVERVHQGDVVTEKNLFDATRGKVAINKMLDLRSLLDDLTDRGCIRLVDRPRPGPGQPRSPYVAVHPAILNPSPGGHSQNSQKAPRQSDSANSANTANGIHETSGDLTALLDHDRRPSVDEFVI